MKESVLDVLMYLFDNHVDDEHDLETDNETLRRELTRAGFDEQQVSGAFEWLEGLVVDREKLQSECVVGADTFRMFNSREMEKLDADCRGFLMFLEQAGILDATDRELVVDRVMALPADEIDLPQLKWIILMVLMNQRGREENPLWTEDVVMEHDHAGPH